jgi:hypothetical protein
MIYRTADDHNATLRVRKMIRLPGLIVPLLLVTHYVTFVVPVEAVVSNSACGRRVNLLASNNDSVVEADDKCPETTASSWP